ncbi:MAG: fructose-6-phosphate aldolase, partial [Anaerolineae bacterium]|nr:fructose-6-phosphate aldolase [Anaerolineae bacterium]
SKEGISIAVTLVFSLNQAIAASCAGADFVAPFVGRLDDINADGCALVQSIKQTFMLQGVKTQVIAASLRTPQTVSQLFAAGCDIVTMPGNILESMLKHPLTEAGLRKFEEDWKKVPQTM